MMKLSLLDGGKPIWVMPAHVIMVGHAYEQPDPGIPPAMQIPKSIGTMVLVPGAQFAVQGQPEALARDIAAATQGIAIMGTTEMRADS